MTAKLRIGRIAGIEISLNWSVLVLFVLLVWTLASGVFPATNPGLSHRADLAMAVAATVGYVLGLLLHELGHALQARRDGMEIDGITLWLFGGVARFESPFAEAAVELRVALAGPLVSLLRTTAPSGSCRSPARRASRGATGTTPAFAT
jgi:Zn-dependent protease